MKIIRRENFLPHVQRTFCFIPLLILFFTLTSCPEFTDTSFGSIHIYLNGGELTSSLTIQKGQTLILKARPDNSDLKDLNIVWEIIGTGFVITNSGAGDEVIIRGEITSFTNMLRVRAWRSGSDRQRTKDISIIVTDAPAAEGIALITGPSSISVNEEGILSAEFIPAWASGSVTWSQSPEGRVTLNAIPNSSSCGVTGLTEGEVTITARTGAYSRDYNLQITASLSGNPVTAIRINFSSNEDGVKLPVSNIIWLYPQDTVTLEAECTGGSPSAITWTLDNTNEAQIGTGQSHTGVTCAVTGVTVSDFYSPPAVLRITARNSDNTNPATAIVLIKTQAKPIWAWDRARDGHLNTHIKQHNPTTSELPIETPRPTLSSYESADNYTMKGRGEYSETFTNGIPIKVKGNFIPYSPNGLLLNSSNNFSGDNPDPVAAPKYGSATSATSYNSTRITFGTNIHANTDSNIHQDGIFDFLTPNKNIRVSVDYEIIWSAGASRDMWIMANNNNANAAQSIMGTNSQLLIEPLIAARGTRATAVTTLDVLDLVNRRVKGYETLERGFIAVIALSNGGSIFVSGVRIEYE